MSVEQILSSIKSHREKEIEHQAFRKAIGRSDASIDNEIKTTYWIVIEQNRAVEEYDDGKIVSRDAPLGAKLIQNYEGTHSYNVRENERIHSYNVKIFNRASFLYDDRLLATDIQINIADDSKTYIFSNLLEVLRNLTEINEENEKIKEEIKSNEAEQAKIEEKYNSIEANDITAKKELEKKLEEKRTVVIKLRRKSKEEETKKKDYLNAIQKYIRTNAELRWQPILDKNQDIIKRMKIFDSGTLIINGGPGTGKTTTLIQRIKFLTSKTIEEYITLNANQKNIIFDQRKCWVFFSPNKLLALFLNNIITQEGLSASDDTVRVWSKHKLDIIRLYGWLGDEKIIFRIYRQNDKIFLYPNSVEVLINSFYEYYLECQKESILKSYKNPNTDNLKDFYYIFKYLFKMKLDNINNVKQNNKIDDKNEQKAFNEMLNIFLDCIPRIYKEYRKECLNKKDNNWNLELLDEFVKNDNQLLHPDEQALLIYIINKICFDIYQNYHTFFQDIKNNYMKKYLDYCKPIIAIDEATDFNAIDLLAMQSLRHPEISSVTLSGDLMQRMTPYGINKWEDISKQISSVEKINLTKSYRQSPTLLSLAKRIYCFSTNIEAEYDSYMRPSPDEPKPLIKVSTDNQEKIEWIAQRIKEIDTIYRGSIGSLPSVAVFVPTESDIDNIVNILDNVLDGSIPVTPCKDGLVLGENSDVRVYAVDKIKGLEFEAAFFYDLDKIINMEEDIMLKYLYVGLSRASFYIGVTMSKPFDEKLSFLKEYFKENETWNSP